MELSIFWFAAAFFVGILDIYFSGFLILIVAIACLLTGVCSLFLVSVYVQIALLILFTGILFFLYLCLHQFRGNHLGESLYLARYVGQKVIVHQWIDNKSARVQFNGKLWDAEIAFPDSEVLLPGSYTIWKIMPNKLILTK